MVSHTPYSPYSRLAVNPPCPMSICADFILAIVTHKGAEADAGHYIGFVKKRALHAPASSTPTPDEDDEDSPDQMLADIWTNTQQAGGSLSQVILGDAACCGGSWHKCVREAEVVIKSVRHPFEMDETHEDWDDRTDW